MNNFFFVDGNWRFSSSSSSSSSEEEKEAKIQNASLLRDKVAFEATQRRRSSSIRIGEMGKEMATKLFAIYFFLRRIMISSYFFVSFSFDLWQCVKCTTQNKYSHKRLRAKKDSKKKNLKKHKME